MKTVALQRARQSLSGVVAHARRERVLITKHGKPAALVIGVEGQDLEDVRLSQTPAFWKLIEARRRQRTVPIGELRAKLAVEARPGRRRLQKAAVRKRRR